MGLAVNEGKESICYRQLETIDSQIMADNYTFDTVKAFLYLGSTVTTKNYVNLEIKRRITLANRYALMQQP